MIESQQQRSACRPTPKNNLERVISNHSVQNPADYQNKAEGPDSGNFVALIRTISALV
jgi:hypothetical protein